MENNNNPRGVSREQRSAAIWRLAFFLLLAALVGGALVGGVIYVTMRDNSYSTVVNNAANSNQDIPPQGKDNQNATVINGKGGSNSTVAAIKPPIPLTPTYRQMVRDQLAQKSKLSTEEIKVEILNNATIYQILTQQNIPPDQVVPTWLEALQTASDKLVQTGTWTSQQSDTNMRFWREKSANSFDQKRVDGEIASWFIKGN